MFFTELTYCDGTNQAIVDNTECTIPAADLHAAPFNLAWGTPVYAKLIATNVKGDSVESDIGNGGTIITEPYAPVDLVEDYDQRTPTTLGFSWQDGADDGGLPILDYRISFAVQGNSYLVLESGVIP